MRVNATRAQGLVAARVLLAISVTVVAGLWGLVSLFSDYPPEWSFARWGLQVLGGHLLAGFLIGMLLPLRWRLATAASWGAILVGLMSLIAILTSSAPTTGPETAFLTRFGSLLIILAAPPVAAFGGYSGSRLVSRGRH